MPQYDGTSGADILFGTSGDTLNGGDGDDLLFLSLTSDYLAMGNSYVNGGAGSDTFRLDLSASPSRVSMEMSVPADGSPAYIWISYGKGDLYDRVDITGIERYAIIGSNYNDQLMGGSGNDLIDGGPGADTMAGGLGDDTYVVDSAKGDIVVETSATGGFDRVQSSVSFFTLPANVEMLTLTGTLATYGTGNELDNTLIGNAANNTLTGDAGNDTLNGMAGADTLIGGTGNDIYTIDDVGDVVTETLGEGIDRVNSSISYTLAANVENLTLTGNAALDGTGNELANVLIGNIAANTLTGGGGNDQLNGGGGADTLVGGTGNDIYTIDDVGDVVTENLSEGTDRVNSSISYTLAANVENLTLTGNAALDGTGNELANVITGNSAANTLTGGGGNDRLNGAGGADTLVGGTGNDVYTIDAADVVIEAAGEGNDLVNSSASYTLGNNLERLTLTGSGAISGTGNALGNVIVGNGAANTLRGEGSSDNLSGGGGADHLYGGVGRDQLTGGTGADNFYFDTALSATANFDRILDFSSVDDTIILDDDIFTTVGAIGTLSANAFVTGAAAQDADDRIIYDNATGNIYYDADGNGAGAQVLFAQVTVGLTLTNEDFNIIG